MRKPFTVLVVCTGNICRSPAVERLFTAGLGDAADIRVTSAGVGAVVGAPISPPMATLLHAAGASSDGFVARQVTEQMLRDADLVLALTKALRSQLVSLSPSVVRRAFTLRELARLARSVDPAALPAGSAGTRLEALIPLAAAQRGQRPVEAGEDDVVDPYGGNDALYRRSFDELGPAVTQIARIVLG
ncbi:MAG: low molecular weight phosphatase family protein [Phycicoccus sp.]|nr:low molecular weight phosphatase family protein [Phycicoccus sp.]